MGNINVLTADNCSYEGPIRKVQFFKRLTRYSALTLLPQARWPLHPYSEMLNRKDLPSPDKAQYCICRRNPDIYRRINPYDRHKRQIVHLVHQGNSFMDAQCFASRHDIIFVSSSAVTQQQNASISSIPSLAACPSPSHRPARPSSFLTVQQSLKTFPCPLQSGSHPVRFARSLKPLRGRSSLHRG